MKNKRSWGSLPVMVVMSFSLLYGLAGCPSGGAAGGNGNQGGNGTNGQETDGTSAAIPVRVMLLVPEDFTEYGEYYGETTGIQEAELKSPLGGRVESINVKTGDFVRTGTSLARIDAQAAANQLATARLNEKIALDEYERQKRFLAAGNASQVAVDRAHLAWLTAQNTRLTAETNYRGAFCITPLTGYVVSDFIEEFQLLPPDTLAFIVADLNQLRIVTGIPEAEREGIKAGDTVDISFSMYPDRSWQGTIYSLGQKVTPGALTFPLEIRMENKDRLLLSGVIATVKVIRRRYSGRITVPIAAVLSDGPVFYVMIADGELARRRNIELEFTGETRMVIKSGLSPGERLIVEGQHIAEDGSPIRIVE